MPLILIGGYPKGFDIPFHPKTTSGRILRKIIAELELHPIYFDLWKNEKEENARKIHPETLEQLRRFESQGYVLISLGRYIEETLADHHITSHYLPHPASRDSKYIDMLRRGLGRFKLK